MAAAPLPTKPAPRPFLRHPSLIFFATATTVAIVAFRARAATLSRNEEAQAKGTLSPGLVTVERSGGGL